MATFPSYQPLYGASKSSAPTVRTAKFGDGYSQRVTFGLNQDAKEWNLRFNLSDEEAAEVEAFLEARAGVESFDWTPPDSATSYKWLCSEWSKTIDNPSRAELTMKFTQVFEP